MSGALPFSSSNRNSRSIAFEQAISSPRYRNARPVVTPSYDTLVVDGFSRRDEPKNPTRP